MVIEQARRERSSAMVDLGAKIPNTKPMGANRINTKTRYFQICLILSRATKSKLNIVFK